MSDEAGVESGQRAADSPGSRFEDVGKGLTVLTTFSGAWVALQKAADLGRRDSLAVTLAVTGAVIAMVYFPRPRKGDAKLSGARYSASMVVGALFALAGAAAHFWPSGSPDKTPPTVAAASAKGIAPGPTTGSSPAPAQPAQPSSAAVDNGHVVVVNPPAPGARTTSPPNPTTQPPAPPTTPQQPAGPTPSRGPESLVIKAGTGVNLYSSHPDWDVGPSLDSVRNLWWGGDPNSISINGIDVGHQDSSVSVLPSGVAPTETNCRSLDYKGADPTAPPLHASENFCVDTGGGPVLVHVDGVVSGGSGSMSVTVTVWG